MNYKLIAVVLFHSTFSFPSCNVSESKINKSISSQVIEKDTSIIDSSFYQVSVIEEVKDFDGSRKCWRLIGGTLIEKTVGEVVPALKANIELLDKALV